MKSDETQKCNVFKILSSDQTDLFSLKLEVLCLKLLTLKIKQNLCGVIHIIQIV